MSPQNGSTDNPKVAKLAAKYDTVPAALTKQQVQGLDEIAKQLKKSKSELIREAVNHYILAFKGEQLEDREAHLTREMKRLEKGLRALLVKNVRISAQTLFFSSLQFELGPPKGALTERAYQELYKKSRAFAAEVLRAGGLSAIEEARTDEQTQEQIVSS
jgi:hypothetical protein